MNKLIAAVALLIGAAALPNLLQAKEVGTIHGMPFFGLPYPYGYVYNRPRMECYTFQEIQTLDGPRTIAVWNCGAPVKAKY
ncbi:MAG TPA: hypothetical protein VEK34_06530 [Methylocella sp.]|nr:hypothetical protein [Methylocella sp.]